MIWSKPSCFSSLTKEGKSVLKEATKLTNRLISIKKTEYYRKQAKTVSIFPTIRNLITFGVVLGLLAVFIGSGIIKDTWSLLIIPITGTCILMLLIDSIHRKYTVYYDSWKSLLMLMFIIVQLKRFNKTAEKWQGCVREHTLLMSEWVMWSLLLGTGCNSHIRTVLFDMIDVTFDGRPTPHVGLPEGSVYKDALCKQFIDFLSYWESPLDRFLGDEYVKRKLLTDYIFGSDKLNLITRTIHL